MASSNDSPDVPIKYESPYHAESIANFPSQSPQSPTLKRGRSEEDMGDSGLKRQRIDSLSSNAPLATPSKALANEEFARLLAQATASTTQQIEQSANIGQKRQPETNVSVNQNEPDRSERLGSGFANDPYLYMRILSLPILESLSTQILSTLAQGPYSETIKIITEPESELGQAYATLKSLFDQTKKIYSQQAPFLSADELNIQETEHRATIRTTNLATFVSSVFGGQDVGFYELNDHFVETFTPDGQPFKKEPGQLFLNLKTQMYLSVASQEEQERAKEDILEDLFPISIEDQLMGRHPDTPLSTSEVEFIECSKERREYLMSAPHDVESIQALSEKYAWEDFLRSLSIHLSKAYEPLIAPYMKRHALTAPTSPARAPNPQNTTTVNSIEHDISTDTERAVQAALQSLNSSQGQYGQQQNGRPQQQYQAPAQNSPYHPQYPGGNIPYPSQSAPTQVLYEQARQAAVAKANPGNTRRPGLPSQRRPWSGEEENALMAGLDQVKGPHWSQILALYGAKGQINEILKDRNQVQLKDKARNLKLFFLKSNIEVPYYLQCVTGELKTRAPSQAARKEAEERARLASDEEQARFNGILTLANGIQEQPRTNGAPEAPMVSSPGAQSFDSQDGPEEFQVVEPEKDENSISTPRTSDELLRQQLLAANASSDGSDDSVQRSGFTAVAT